MNYVETSEGRLLNAKGSVTRYVRLYSSGSNADEMNHYRLVFVLDAGRELVLVLLYQLPDFLKRYLEGGGLNCFQTGIRCCPKARRKGRKLEKRNS
jgi:hypothetical protein